jgi:hypothetical protein
MSAIDPACIVGMALAPIGGEATIGAIERQ